MSIKRTQAAANELVHQVSQLDENQLKSLANLLKQYTIAERQATIKQILQQKSRYLTLILEDLLQQQNISALVRTAECMGLLDLHIIECNNKYVTNKQIVKGADNWLNIWHYQAEVFENPLLTCIQNLKSKGYAVFIACPENNSVSLNDIPVTKPIAVLLGSEKYGHSPQAESLADGRLHIPMFGATESLNVSVSGAIIMYAINQALIKHQPKNLAAYGPQLLDEVLCLLRSRNALQATTQAFLKQLTICQ